MSISHRESLADDALADAHQHLKHAGIAGLMLDRTARRRALLAAAEACVTAASLLVAEADTGPAARLAIVVENRKETVRLLKQRREVSRG